jgi:hypothetical protein
MGTRFEQRQTLVFQWEDRQVIDVRDFRGVILDQSPRARGTESLKL